MPKERLYPIMANAAKISSQLNNQSPLRSHMLYLIIMVRLDIPYAAQYPNALENVCGQFSLKVKLFGKNLQLRWLHFDLESSK